MVSKCEQHDELKLKLLDRTFSGTIQTCIHVVWILISGTLKYEGRATQRFTVGPMKVTDVS